MMESSSHTSTQSNLTIENGIDCFYGMVMSPLYTLEELSDKTKPGLTPLLGPIFMVLFAGLANYTTRLSSAPSDTLMACVAFIASAFCDLFFWLMMVVFLILLSALLKHKTSIRACFLVTGWAFTPLIFKGVAACFSNATIFGAFVSCLLSIWFLVLELFAFDTILKLGKLKTLGVILVLPPCLFITYLLSMIFAGLMISDGPF